MPAKNHDLLGQPMALNRSRRILGHAGLLAASLGAVAAGCGSLDSKADSPAPAVAPRAPASEPVGDAAESSMRRLLEEMGVHYFPKERQLEVHGWVNMQKGLVEVFACAPQGKTHEAVVVLDCVPRGLHAGLLALGLKPGSPVEAGTEADYHAPRGDGVEIEVRWRGSDGSERSARAEDWIWSQKEGRPMAPAAWVFAGSFLEPVDGPEPAGGTFAADYIKSLVTTYHDATSILENPFPDGIDDTVYYANDQAVPPAGTPISAIFKPAREGGEGKGR